jgi:hypothetical protein
MINLHGLSAAMIGLKFILYIVRQVLTGAPFRHFFRIMG